MIGEECVGGEEIVEVGDVGFVIVFVFFCDFGGGFFEVGNVVVLLCDEFVEG